MVEIRAFNYGAIGLFAGFFFGDMKLAITLFFLVKLLFPVWLFNWITYTLPDTAVTAPQYINIVTDFHYPAIYALFAFLGSSYIKYSTHANRRVKSEGPLERIHSIGSYLLGWVFFVAIVASSFIYNVTSYPMKFIWPLLVIAVLWALYYWFSSSSVLHHQIAHTEKGVNVHDPSFYPLTYGRCAMQHRARFVYFTYAVGIFCLGQFFQKLTALEPYQEIYTQYIVALIIGGYLCFVAWKSRVSPLAFIASPITALYDGPEGKCENEKYTGIPECDQDIESGYTEKDHCLVDEQEEHEGCDKSTSEYAQMSELKAVMMTVQPTSWFDKKRD